MTATGKIAFVRPPRGYRYNVLTVGEDPIITYALTALDGPSRPQVFDFHLQRDLNMDDVLKAEADTYVIALRESGEIPHYVERIGAHLRAHDKNVVIYGQTARLRHSPEYARLGPVLVHDENVLMDELGIEGRELKYANDSKATPYMFDLNLQDWQRRRMLGVIETTRGCTFGCRFCFINQGKNYPDRWTLRDNEIILSDIEEYVRRGVKNFFVYDSEFLGSRTQDHDSRRDLLQRIASTFPGIHLKLYARADSLNTFDDYELLSRAGVAQVFIGVESFDDNDLRALNKGASGKEMQSAVEQLKQHNIFAHMNFITFNRNTTPASIRTNIETLRELAQTKPRYLGTPAFTFAFESAWRPADRSRENKKSTLPVDQDDSREQLSGRTYVSVDLEQKKQPSLSTVIFDAKLEPVMEAYRLLSYEWNKKLVRLSLARDSAGPTDREKIESWFEDLYNYCLDEQELALTAYECGALSLDTLPEYSEDLFHRIAAYHHEHLPAHLAALETYAEHASAIEYAEDTELLEHDEYWHDVIPALDQRLRSETQCR